MTPQPTLARTRAIILAAGLGTRMKSRLPKVLHPICGRPMIDYVLDAAEAASGSRPLVVWSPPVAAVHDAVAARADTAEQAQPLGTGHALAAGLAGLAGLAGIAPDAAGQGPGSPEQLLVLSGDVPLVDVDLLDALLAAHADAGAAVSLICVITTEPGRLGRVIRDDEGEIE